MNNTPITFGHLKGFLVAIFMIVVGFVICVGIYRAGQNSIKIYGVNYPFRCETPMEFYTINLSVGQATSMPSKKEMDCLDQSGHVTNFDLIP